VLYIGIRPLLLLLLLVSQTAAASAAGVLPYRVLLNVYKVLLHLLNLIEFETVGTAAALLRAAK
jgi:hypothetical protein